MTSETPQKKRFSVAVMGGGGVGKSCLTLRVIHDMFQETYDPTIEDAYNKDNFLVDDEPTPIEIFDTAGQDTFVSMRDNYYKNSHGFIFVYSVTDRSSLADVQDRFENLMRVRHQVSTRPIKNSLNLLVDLLSVCKDVEGGEPLPPVIVVGNKCDLEEDRVVSTEDGQKFTLDLADGVMFEETSAKANINVDKQYGKYASRIHKRCEAFYRDFLRRKFESLFLTG